MEQIPETREEIMEYVRAKFRESLDEYINRPITPLLVKDVQARLEEQMKKLYPSPFTVEVTPKEDDPAVFEIVVYRPPYVTISFIIEQDKDVGA